MNQGWQSEATDGSKGDWSLWLFLYLFSISLSLYLFVCLSIYLPICKLNNETILRDVLRFWTWQRQKRSNSMRLSSMFELDNVKNETILRDFFTFLNLTTSKTKQFCETSSILEFLNLIEGSLEVKLPTIWTDEKQSREEAERRERLEERRAEKKEDADAWKGRKVAKHCVFPMICGSGSLKRRVRSQLARWEMKNCTPLWREAHFEVKMYKTPQLRSALKSCDVEKVHAVVARSTFPSQNVQNTPRSDHFWKLRCRKSARRCGAKRISKWKCTKHTRSGPLLEAKMSKKCTPLWREAHFEVCQKH